LILYNILKHIGQQIMDTHKKMTKKKRGLVATTLPRKIKKMLTPILNFLKERNIPPKPTNRMSIYQFTLNA
ncbi:MAG: hypothetical protein ACK518_03540, partial [bacterium]